MNEDLDISIEIRFQTNLGVPAEILIETLRRITWAIHAAEEEELTELIAELPELGEIGSDAARYRFGRLDAESALNIEFGAKGSLILIGAGAGLAYWILDKTLGETVTEAWRESSGHERLKSLLKKRVFKKRDKIAKRIARAPIRDTKDISVMTNAEESPKITVSIEPDEGARIPKPSEVAEREGYRRSEDHKDA